jgi:hypothetical protein
MMISWWIDNDSGGEIERTLLELDKRRRSVKRGLLMLIFYWKPLTKSSSVGSSACHVSQG